MTLVFISYSHADEQLRNELEKHLSMLKRQGRVDVWHDRRIAAGDVFDNVISAQLEQADIVLLLVSADFLSSEYCYGIEMTRAMERARAGQARVIPVILRSCQWHDAPFGGLLAAPQDGKAVTKWADRDEAWTNVVGMITSALPPGPGKTPPRRGGDMAGAGSARGAHPVADERTPRSSNLRIRQVFTDAQRARFLKESFEIMARFFESSLEELQRRNSDIESDFTRVDAHQFTASVFRQGKSVASCRIRLDAGRAAFGNGITFSYETGSSSSNSFNESLSVEADDQALFLRALGMAIGYTDETRRHLSQEGAAEYYWSLLIKRLQE
jgi:hypothetical protein